MVIPSHLLLFYCVRNVVRSSKNLKKKLKRKIQLFQSKDLENVGSKKLRNNILNGYKLKGNW
ncbi:hypothetical protein DRJ22_03760 [Candidatus Woesearchaeota archaeon]|nr:MAG: hypothetical protein DRJ22_03760 [Candidatus Woesearchaeota archaeon]